MLWKRKSTGTPCAALFVTNSHFAVFMLECFAYFSAHFSLRLTQDSAALENIVASLFLTVGTPVSC